VPELKELEREGEEGGIREAPRVKGSKTPSSKEGKRKKSLKMSSTGQNVGKRRKKKKKQIQERIGGVTI